MIRKDLRKNRNYSKAINAARDTMLKYKNAHPFCELCGKNTQEVHHITPIESELELDKMIRLATDWSNLKSLCRACHVKVHVEMKSKKAEVVKARTEQRASHLLQSFGVESGL